MKTIIHYQFDIDEGNIVDRMTEALGRLSNFRDEAEAATLARGDENPRSGWNALTRGGDFVFDQFLHASEYLAGVVKVAQSRTNPDPMVAVCVREAVEGARGVLSDLNGIMAKAMR